MWVQSILRLGHGAGWHPWSLADSARCFVPETSVLVCQRSLTKHLLSSFLANLEASELVGPGSLFFIAFHVEREQAAAN